MASRDPPGPAPSVGLRPIPMARHGWQPSPTRRPVAASPHRRHATPFHEEGTMKLKLSLEDLRVDAFATTAAATAARGTVRGYDSIVFTVRDCPPMTADDTCGMTC